MKNLILVTGLLVSCVFCFGQSLENARAAQIFSVGLTVGYAEYGAMKGDKPSFLAEKLQYAIDNAEATGCIPIAKLKQLRQKMLNTSNSNSLYKEIEAFRRDELWQQVLTYCNCSDGSFNGDVVYGKGEGTSGVIISVNKPYYAKGESVIVSFSGMSGSSSDWIAITAKTKPASTYDTYKYTDGKISGSLTFDGLQPGEYEARAYFKNTYKLEAFVGFTITSASTATGNPSSNVMISTDKKVYAEDDPVIVSFSGMSGSSTDWIAITAKSKPASTYDVYKYTQGKQSGSLKFDYVKAGEYEARAYFKDSYNLEAAVSFTIKKKGQNILPPDNPYVQLGPPDNVNAEVIPWNRTVSSLNLRGKNGQKFCYQCESNPSGNYHSVWGTDEYTDDSSICSAAVHAGVISDSGGTVCIKVTPGLSSYVGTERNGVRTGQYGKYAGSYVFVTSTGSTVRNGGSSNNGASSGNVSNWKVDYGTYNNKGNQIDAEPAGDGYTSYYIAPSAFKGNWSLYNALSFEKKSWGGDYYGPDEFGATGDVILKNGSKTARYDIAKDHSGNWKSFSVPLSGSGWKLSGGAKSLNDVLGNVTEFKIRAEFGSGTDYSSLRNVTIN